MIGATCRGSAHRIEFRSAPSLPEEPYFYRDRLVPRRARFAVARDAQRNDLGPASPKSGEYWIICVGVRGPKTRRSEGSSIMETEGFNPAALRGGQQRLETLTKYSAGKAGKSKQD